MKAPSKEWLIQQYSVLSRSTQSIANELDCSTETVRYWRRKYCIPGDRKKIMSLAAHRKYKRPTREWLREEYILANRSLTSIAREIGCNHQTVALWMRAEGVELKSKELRYCKMRDAGNGAWKGGTSATYQKRSMLRRKPLRCEWCGDEGDSKHIQVHHVDHDRKNSDPSNLLLLCYHCNLLEAQLNRLRGKGLATFVVEPGERIEVRFIKQALRVSA